MSSLLDGKESKCDCFQQWLEESAVPYSRGEISVEQGGSERGLLETYVNLVGRAPADVREHAQECADCRYAAEDIVAARNLVRELEPATEPSPWFISRVMAVIAAQEAERFRASAIWLAVSRYASRLSWIAAVALLVTCSWLYKRPAVEPQSASAFASEHLFDPPALPASHDDVLVSQNGPNR